MIKPELHLDVVGQEWRQAINRLPHSVRARIGEDLWGEGILALWTAGRHFHTRGGRSFRTVARSRVRVALRKAIRSSQRRDRDGARGTAGPDAQDDSILDTAPSPSEGLDSWWRGQGGAPGSHGRGVPQVKWLLRRLSRRERAVVRWTVLEGRTLDWVARRWKTNRKAVWLLKHTALRKMAVELKDKEADSDSVALA